MTKNGPSLLTLVRACLGRPAAKLDRAVALASRGLHHKAFPLFAAAARAGLPDAQYRLGRCYLLGHGVPPGTTEALRWLGRAAEAGQVAARTQLAALALQGVTPAARSGLFDPGGGRAGEPDYDTAERWARLAAADGSAEAQALLAFILTAGPPGRRDEAAANALYRQSADAGWPRGQLGLAMRLLNDGKPEAAAQARALLKDAAASGAAAAHYLLGTIDESAADFPAAAASYRAGAELGHAPAQARYGFALLEGRGIEKDPFAAETWLRRAGLAGEAQAAAVLGSLLANQDPPNHAEAAMWLERAAETGHAAAARTLGRIRLLGQGVRPDRQAGVRWLLAAARAGDAAARDDLVRLALSRQLSEPDRRPVIGWLRQAATEGAADARFKLGLCYADGIGVERDEHQARYWFLLAAGTGMPEAAMAAGEMLANGRGGPPDVPRAIAFFHGAANAGHAGAYFALGILRADNPAEARQALRHAAAIGHPEARLMLERLPADA